MKTIAEVSKETLQIEAVLKNAKSGEFIMYHNLQHLSGVRMDERGKHIAGVQQIGIKDRKYLTDVKPQGFRCEEVDHKYLYIFCVHEFSIVVE